MAEVVSFKLKKTVLSEQKLA